MNLILCLLAIVAGTLAASSIIIQKLPDADQYIQKIKPYEGYIGIGALLIALMGLLDINMILRQGFFDMMITFTCIASCIVMGFLMGFPIIQEKLLEESSAEIRDKGNELYKKLTPYKVLAGLLGISTGIMGLLFV